MKLLSDVRDCFVRPTTRQWEAYGRFAHTLAAASTIGAFTIVWTGDGWTFQALWHMSGLACLGLVLFVAGSVIFGTEDNRCSTHS